MSFPTKKFKNKEDIDYLLKSFLDGFCEESPKKDQNIKEESISKEEIQKDAIWSFLYYLLILLRY